jgi:hypothetical protein
MSDLSLVHVYQLKVWIQAISPMVWRRLLVRSDSTLADLHYTLQIAIGWSDTHLNRFHIHGKDYGVYHSGGISFADDPEQVSLSVFGFRPRERFLYEYDFGDACPLLMPATEPLPVCSLMLPVLLELARAGSSMFILPHILTVCSHISVVLPTIATVSLKVLPTLAEIPPILSHLLTVLAGIPVREVQSVHRWDR